MSESDGKVRIIIDTNAEAAAKQLNDVGSAFKKNADTIQKSSSVYSGYEKAIRNNIEVLRELALGGNQNTDGFKQLAAETKNYKLALEQANSAVSKATGEIQKQTNPVNALTSKLKGLVGAYLSIRGIQAAFNGIIQSTEAFREQERAVLSLNNTLANAGVYSDSYSKHIQELASTIQGYSNYGDEAIIKAQALGQSFIGQTKITDQLTKATVDFAAATGMDLQQAFTLVGKSIGSPTNALARYGIELNKNMSDSEKMAAIATQLGNRFDGQAKQMANASAQLKNALGDLAEQLGGVFNPMVEATQKVLIKATNALTDWIKKTREASKQNDINALNEALKYQQEQLKNATGEEKKLWEQRIAQTQKYLNVQKQTTITNKKPVKVSDEVSSFGSYSSPVKVSGGGTSQAKQIKDSYDLATEAVEKARRAVLNAGIQFGASSPEVAKAFEQYKLANEKIQGLQDIFKTEETKTKFQQLQEEIQKTTLKLQELYLGGQGGTDAFNNTKNQLNQLQTQLKNMNTAITSNVGLDWSNVANSIRSNLTSAILTPLQQGESAFNRLGTIGLNIVQMIGQEIISNLLKQITLEKTLAAIKMVGSSIGGMFGSFFGGGAMAMATVAKNGKVIQNGKVLPFAKGGIVNQPTLFPMANGAGLMGEAGAEAIMPLTRKNGKLGVDASGANQTVVNIYNQSGASVETQKRDDGGMDIFIKKVNAAMMNERTSTGFQRAYERENRKGVQAC